MRKAAAVAIVLVVAVTGVSLIRSQQFANRMILARLDEVRDSLQAQRVRAGELQSQVTTLTDRVAKLEADNFELRRQIAALLKRKPVEIGSLALPPVLEAMPLVPMAPPSLATAEAMVVEPLPITWSSDWSSYQPAGIIAPSPAVVLERKFTDPAFVRKLYYSYASLQVTDTVTTLVGLSHGARETNPFLKGTVQNPMALIGLKAATIAGTVVAVETLRKKSPVVATATLIALNATLAVVVVNNINVVARQAEPPR